MTQIKLVLAAILLLAPAAATRVLAQSGGLCPDGYNSQFNVNEPGCTLCSAPTDCAVQCISTTCICAPNDAACCTNNPCCQNCPDPKPLRCSTVQCTCEPGSCCSTVCPSSAPAPVSSAPGLALLAAVLVALGTGAVRLAARRR